LFFVYFVDFFVYFVETIDFSSPLDVSGEVNFFREFGDVDLESVLDLVEDLGVSLVRHKGDGEALEDNDLVFRRS
jgi:hypothetical protein